MYIHRREHDELVAWRRRANATAVE